MIHNGMKCAVQPLCISQLFIFFRFLLFFRPVQKRLGINTVVWLKKPLKCTAANRTDYVCLDLHVQERSGDFARRNQSTEASQLFIRLFEKCPHNVFLGLDFFPLSAQFDAELLEIGVSFLAHADGCPVLAFHKQFIRFITNKQLRVPTANGDKS